MREAAASARRLWSTPSVKRGNDNADHEPNLTSFRNSSEIQNFTLSVPQVGLDCLLPLRTQYGIANDLAALAQHTLVAPSEQKKSAAALGLHEQQLQGGGQQPCFNSQQATFLERQMCFHCSQCAVCDALPSKAV